MKKYQKTSVDRPEELEVSVPERVSVVMAEIAGNMQVGLLALAAWPRYQRRGSRAPLLLLAGTLVFSLSLYLLSLTGLRWLGAVTPLGGLLILLGWGLVALDVWRGKA